MHRPGPVRPAGSDLATLLEDGRALLDSARLSVATEAPLFDHAEAADFAGRVEDMSRALEYLQVLAAQAVERTRTEAQMARRGSAATAPEWRTGWTEPGATEPGVTDTGAGVVDPTATLALGAEAESSAAGLLDDGYRNAAEFLRARLRIGIGEARRRLAL
ncbi:HNH endonuclease signature motif containing protein, partial [Paenarthrobacter sp. FR1]